MSHTITELGTTDEPKANSVAPCPVAEGPSDGADPHADRRALEAAREAMAEALREHQDLARQAADLGARIERLKQQGTLLVKQYQTARKAAEIKRQKIDDLKRQIAAGKERLTGAPAGAPAGETAPVRPAAGEKKPTDPVGPNPRRTVTLATPHQAAQPVQKAAPAPPRSQSGLSKEGTKDPSMTAAPTATEAPFMDGNPLIGQLLDYQSRQARLARRRRFIVAALLILTTSAALLGFSWLMLEMYAGA